MLTLPVLTLPEMNLPVLTLPMVARPPMTVSATAQRVTGTPMRPRSGRTRPATGAPIPRVAVLTG